MTALTTIAVTDEHLPEAGADVIWRLADTNLWVASRNGSFGGTIDGGRYYVRDTFAQYLGEFTDLVAAQQHLERHIDRLLSTRLSDLP